MEYSIPFPIPHTHQPDRLTLSCYSQLHDVVCERDVLETATAFGVSPGVLTQTQESAARHAGQIVSVCGPMGWGDVEGLVLRLQGTCWGFPKSTLFYL